LTSFCGNLDKFSYDPRCKVRYQEGNTTYEQYHPDHPPTNANCLQCSGLGQAHAYGGQKWRALTHRVEGVVKGPKLYLGYYNTAPYGPLSTVDPPNRDTEIMQSLFRYVDVFTQTNWQYDNWINGWLNANIISEDGTVGHPAAVIDATDPDNMAHYALLYNSDESYWYIPNDPIYPTLANPQ